MVDVNLADLITIVQGEVEVYNDNRHNKPEVGQKLNKPAIIYLYNMGRKFKNLDKYIAKLKKGIEEAGG